MRKTYKCSNIKFCMENDNQRRTWEHLQKMTRKDGSYGKVLSDAFVASLDSEKVKKANGTNKDGETFDSLGQEREGGKMSGLLESILDAKFQTMQEILTKQIERYFREYMLSPTDTDEPKETIGGGVPEQMPEMSEDMMAFAFAMGE